MKRRRSYKKSVLLCLAPCLFAISSCSEESPESRGSGGSASGTGGSASGGDAGSSAGGSPSGGSAGADPATGGSAGDAGAGGGSGGSGENRCMQELFVTSSGLVHVHTVTIALEDISAGSTKLYETSESGNPVHTHWVQLTDSDFAALQAGSVVRKKTCNTADHEYVFSCAPEPPEPVIPDDCGAQTCGQMDEVCL